MTWNCLSVSQNQNPLTDYDKTLHNWLCPRVEHVTQNFCQLTPRERLDKYVKYKALSFYSHLFFPRTRTEVIRGRIFTHSGSNYAQSLKEVHFWGLHDGRKHLGGQIPQNRQNWALIRSAERLSCASMKIDVIEEWRHWRVAALQCKRCQSVFDDHCQTYGNLYQTAVKMPNHCTHPHWPKQTTYALLCTSSSTNFEISAVIILRFLFLQCWTKYT